MADVRLAIVGSTLYESDHAARVNAFDTIWKALEHLKPALVISGGAPGIDVLATATGDLLGIPTEAYLPLNQRWEPDGFKARNARIAQECSHLLSIRHPASTTYGSGWTADHAEQLGRVVYRREVGP